MNPNLKRIIRVGAPFFAFMLVGSYGLSYFAEIRYWVSRNRRLFSNATPDEVKQQRTLETKTLETIYKEEIDGKTFDNWENVRAPRPWEPETFRVNEEQARKQRRERIAERLHEIESRAEIASQSSKRN